MPTGNRPSIAVAQIGARMHYAVPRILEEAGMLYHFYTDICATRGATRVLKTVLPSSWMPAPVRRLFGRVPEGVPPRKITDFPTFGLRYKVNQWGARSITDTTRGYLWAGERFGDLIEEEHLAGADGIYAFRSAALELFRKARDHDVKTILEQPNAQREVMHELLRREYREHPEWQEPPAESEYLSEEIEREKKERAEADVILCGSDFVERSIGKAGEPTEKCVVVPYGVDFPARESPRDGPNEPLRVLMVGTVGLRKGAPYLAEAARQSQDFATFRAVGPVELTNRGRNRLAEHVSVTGRVPRSEIHRHYEWADVFVLPSICEGSATVVYEALAHALPVVCTPNAGAIVQDGEDGFVVSIRNAEEIVDRLQQLTCSPDLYRSMSEQALSRYERNGNLSAYNRRLVTTIKNVFQI